MQDKNEIYRHILEFIARQSYVITHLTLGVCAGFIRYFVELDKRRKFSIKAKKEVEKISYLSLFVYVLSALASAYISGEIGRIFLSDYSHLFAAVGGWGGTETLHGIYKIAIKMAENKAGVKTDEKKDEGQT